MFNLYGNPGDYAWGAGGLDSIITQVSATFVSVPTGVLGSGKTGYRRYSKSQ